jgi:hypothetical protein
VILGIVGCRSTAPSPTSAPQIVAVAESSHVADAAPSASVVAPSTTAGNTTAVIAFQEHPGGLQYWDFDVHGLPAADTKTDAIVVADISHGHIASSLSMSLRWLKPGHKEPLRTMTLLGQSEASHVLYEVDDVTGPREMAKLAERVRAQTREANRVLGATSLRAIVACTLQSPKGNVGCVHPQAVTCGALVAELRDDTLTWRMNTQSGSKKLGWRVAPMQIGEGAKREMITCVQEAHFDPVSMGLVTFVETSCRGGGSDACYFPEEWRGVALK